MAADAPLPREVGALPARDEVQNQPTLRILGLSMAGVRTLPWQGAGFLGQ